MKANEILETCLYVDNLDLAKAFYGEVLEVASPRIWGIEEQAAIHASCGRSPV